MNAKFENLVQRCYYDLPRKKKELADVQKQIDRKWEEYNRLCTRMQDIDNLIRTLQTLKQYGEDAAKKAKKIAETGGNAERN